MVKQMLYPAGIMGVEIAGMTIKGNLETGMI